MILDITGSGDNSAVLPVAFKLRGRAAFALPLCALQSAESLLRCHDMLTPDLGLVLRLSASLARGLQGLHEKRVVHAGAIILRPLPLPPPLATLITSPVVPCATTITTAITTTTKHHHLCTS